jgi:WD40 repeat protein
MNTWANLHLLRQPNTFLAQQNLRWTLLHHTAPVMALAWQADRQWLATGSADAEVVVWDLHCHGKPPNLSEPKALPLRGHAKVRKTPSWLRSWANFSLL